LKADKRLNDFITCARVIKEGWNDAVDVPARKAVISKALELVFKMADTDLV